MTGCEFETLDRLVAGELSGEEIAELRRHLTSCSSCTRELVSLRSDLRLFRIRAASQNSNPPEFERVQRRMQRHALHRERWLPSIVLLSSTAALAALLLGAHPSPMREGPPSAGASSSIAHDGGSSEQRVVVCESSSELCEAPPMSWAPIATIVHRHDPLPNEPGQCSTNPPLACEPL